MEDLLDLDGDEAAAAAPVRVPILLPVALDQTYDYFVPPHLDLEPGCFVLVPFGPQVRVGIVWDKPVASGQLKADGKPVGQGKAIDPKRMKTVTERLDVPPLPVPSLRFAEWVARYTLGPLGMVVRMMMSAPAAFEPQKPRFGAEKAATRGTGPARSGPTRWGDRSGPAAPA